MVGIFENIGESFKFGFRECYGDGLKGFLRMLALFITFIIPIVCFIPAGIFLKIYRGEKPDFTNAAQSFIRGLLAFVVGILYMLIPIILLAIFVAIGLVPEVAGGDAGAIIGVLIQSIGVIIAVIAAVILGFVAVPAEVNFARNGFAAAFKFSEIFGMISKAGFAKYILSYIVWCIILAIIVGILGFIGTNVAVLGGIISLLVTIPVAFFGIKFWANVFAA